MYNLINITLLVKSDLRHPPDEAPIRVVIDRQFTIAGRPNPAQQLEQRQNGRFRGLANPTTLKFEVFQDFCSTLQEPVSGQRGKVCPAPGTRLIHICRGLRSPSGHPPVDRLSTLKLMCMYKLDIKELDLAVW